MKKSMLWVVLGAHAVGALSCGGEPLDQAFARGESAIVGGSTTSSLPAVGMITNDGYPYCTGTLIESTKVLTAGHCVVDASASSLEFVIKTSSGSQEVLPVKSIKPHPSFSMSTIQNDIGYMILGKVASVAPMRINTTRMDSSWVGTSLVFVGYGVNDGYNGSGAGVKRYVEMPVAEVGSSTFSYGGSGKNTCSGDSGGPAFVKDSGGNFLAAGVTSYGDQYCTSYGVDTRVDVYASFLGIGSQPTQPTEPTDPCQGESYEGRCSGKTLIWCESDQVKTLTCARSCGWDSSKQYYNCL